MDRNLLILLDGDIIAYELASIGEYDSLDDDGNFIEHVIRPFAYLEVAIEGRVADIMEACNTEFEPIVYLTGDDNFRHDVAKLKPYKGNRKAEKPFHLKNVEVYLRSRFNTYTSKGCEADDLLAISQTDYFKRFGTKKENARTVIATRDKDLLQVRGWHYGWECGRQPEQPLHWVDSFGRIEPHYKEVTSVKTGKITKRFKKLTGEGWIFFCAQCLIGDIVDNIPGLPACGGAKAYDLLTDTKTEREAWAVVVGEYKEKYEEQWEEQLTEQARLLWMIRERKEDGSLKHWSKNDTESTTH